MRIDFGSSGGIANVELAYQADTHSMREADARELERLVESSEVFELGREDVNPSVTVGRADVITYRLSVSDGPRRTTLWLNDVTAPASVRPLLEYLSKLAREQKRGQV